MAQIKRFEDLRIWQQARELCRKVSGLLKDTERVRFSLQDQMARSSGSVMDNIAEGFERNGNKEFKNFLSIAKASCGEVRSQLYRFEDQFPGSKDRVSEIRSEAVMISKGIQRLIEHLKRSDLKGSKFEEDPTTYGVASDAPSTLNIEH